MRCHGIANIVNDVPAFDVIVKLNSVAKLHVDVHAESEHVPLAFRRIAELEVID